MLYGKSGSLKGDALPKMMLAALERSGRILSDAEANLLETAVDAAEKQLAQKNHTAAARAIAAVARLGELGQIASFAENAIRANEIVAELIEYARTSLEQFKQQSESTQETFDLVLSLVETQKAFSDFPQLKNEIKTTIRVVKKNKATRADFKPAESLVRAREFAMSTNARTRRRAVSAYSTIIKRYPNSKASAVARAELTVIQPDAAVLTTVPGDNTEQENTKQEKTDDEKAVEQKQEYRVWTDRGGRFELRAKLVEYEQGKAKLLKKDGTTVTLPIGRLSEKDRQYLKGIK